MQKNFFQALKFTLQFEGGYVNHPRDPGGPTNMGITIATLSHELGRAATVDDVKRLTVDLAGDIYRKKYWNVINGDELPSGVDMLAFDIAVNSGPGRALRWLEASKLLPPVERVKYLDRQRRAFWQRLPTWATFGRGWTSRENAVFAAALRLAQ